MTKAISWWPVTFTIKKNNPLLSISAFCLDIVSAFFFAWHLPRVCAYQLLVKLGALLSR